MKWNYKQSLLLLFFPALLAAQNGVPSIQNLQATVDWNANTLEIQFDAFDPENDPLDISLEFSNNAGKTYSLTAMVPVSGAVGFPVMPGNALMINCDVSALVGLGGGFTVRVIADDRQVFDLQELVDQVDSNLLRANLSFVEGIRHRTAGLYHLQAVRDSMGSLFENLGLHTEMQTFPYGIYMAQNVLGTAAGSGTADTTVIVDAHYDTVASAPGADDNGSGTVGVWEIARILSQYPSKKTLRFIGFDLEEAGLLGSAEYVSSGISADETIEGVFNFEMIGYYSEEPNTQTLPTGFELLFPAVASALEANDYRGDFITNVGSGEFPEIASLFESSVASYVPDLKLVSILEPVGFPLLDLRRSDHTPFWVSGIPALMLTDGANFRNQCYHTAGDTLDDKLNFTFMSNVVKATLAAAAQMAEIQHGAWATAHFAGTVQTNTLRQICTVSAGTFPAGSQQVGLYFGACPLTDLSVALFDANGALHHRESIAAVSENNWYSLRVSALSPGIYFLKLQAAEGSQTLKVIVI